MKRAGRTHQLQLTIADLVDEAHDVQLWEYLVMAAHGLVNAPRQSGGPDLGLTPAGA